MSEQNVELYRRVLEAVNARDMETVIALCDPQIEFHSAFAAVGGGVYHGHDGMRIFFEELKDAWEGGEIHLDPEAYFDLGEHTLTFLRGARARKGERRGRRGAGSHGREVARRPLRVRQGLHPKRGRAQGSGCLRGCARADRPVTWSTR